jgi:glycosyltransferase involved in cell wall biosynthesis
MGINYFCTFCGIILKKFGQVDFVIYRVMDFFPLPPSGMYRLLNRIFYQFDKFCLKNSDFLWFTTEGHIIGREKYGYFDRKKSQYEIIPLAIDQKKFDKYSNIDRKVNNTLVYCGVVSKYHLLDILFKAMRTLKTEIPNIKLNLIGSGPDLKYFQDLAQEMDLQKNIIFHGFLQEGQEFYNIMKASDLGIAFYKDEENFMKYTEPAKVKYYLNFGIPALVSDVPRIARELEKKKVSFCVKNDEKEVANKIKTYFKDAKLQSEIKKNIKEYVKEIEVNNLLRLKFEKTFVKIYNKSLKH